MFRPRRRYGGGYRRGGGIGIFLLGLQLMQLYNFISRSNNYFPVTLGVLALNIIAYLQPGGFAWPSLQQACISVQGVWFQNQWKRVLFSPFFHSSDFHLYYNMASFMWKAVSLERHFGTPYFLYMISVFSIGTGAVYLGLNYMIAEVFNQWSYVQSCAVGFSGVIFALKVVTTHMQPHGLTRVMGFIPVPMRLACWVELVIISVLFPNVSFVGHLAGILVGLAFVSGPLKAIMDMPLSLGTDFPQMGGNNAAGRRSYDYRAAQTGYHNAPVNDERENSEERDLQAAIRRSLEQEEAPQRHTTPNRSEEDREVQEAIERSLADSGTHRPEAIPPYNPHFPTAPERAHTVRTDHDQYSEQSVTNDSVNVRRRHVESAQDRVTSRDSLRAARLRRFAGGTN